MGQGEVDAADHPSDDHPLKAQDHARKRRTLRRIAEALGRPVEDFFASELEAGPGTAEEEPGA